METISKIKSFFAKRRRKRAIRKQLSDINLRLDLLWDDLDENEPESENAYTIRQRISILTNEVTKLAQKL